MEQCPPFVAPAVKCLSSCLCQCRSPSDVAIYFAGWHCGRLARCFQGYHSTPASPECCGSQSRPQTTVAVRLRLDCTRSEAKFSREPPVSGLAGTSSSPHNLVSLRGDPNFKWDCDTGTNQPNCASGHAHSNVPAQLSGCAERSKQRQHNLKLFSRVYTL